MPYILYVARDRRNPNRYDIGSTLCLRLVDMVPQTGVDVYDCEALTNERPSWLIGTPTLVAESGGDVYRGIQALNRLQTLCLDSARSQQSSSKGDSGKRASTASHGNAAGAVKSTQAAGGDVQTNRPPSSMTARSDEGLESLWTAPLDIQDAEEEEDMFSKKLTGDDLARASSKREKRTEDVSQGKPPAPPPAEKD